jgi:hypothetical protein
MYFLLQQPEPTECECLECREHGELQFHHVLQAPEKSLHDDPLQAPYELAGRVVERKM